MISQDHVNILQIHVHMDLDQSMWTCLDAGQAWATAALPAAPFLAKQQGKKLLKLNAEIKKGESFKD